MLVFSATMFLNCSPFSTEKELVDYVDPLLGTSSSRWMLFPGPTLPFGMVKLSPDNSELSGLLDSGYEYTTESISGFSHVHSWNMSGFITMPTTGKVKIKPGSKKNPDEGYRSRYTQVNEKASTGYYSVYLDDYDVKAELTTTTRTGFQRYTFPKSNEAHILFDLKIPEESSPKIINAEIVKVSASEITGFVKRNDGKNE